MAGVGGEPSDDRVVLYRGAFENALGVGVFGDSGPVPFRPERYRLAGVALHLYRARIAAAGRAR